MIKNKKYSHTSTAPFGGEILTVISEDFETETGTLEVSGTGQIRVTNTGGSSASEGGMGSDSDDDKAKGDLTKPDGGKTGNTPGDEEDDDTTFDPIKKNVREAEKKADRE